MAIAASLSDFSLLELFLFIERGRRTGMVSFDTPAGFYIWFKEGHIVAATNRTDHEGLALLIKESEWVSDRVLNKLMYWCYPLNQPLGLYLKKHSVLQSSQLEQIFKLQILQAICFLLQLEDCEFKFERNVLLPAREMTGFSIAATEALEMGLQALKQWDTQFNPDSASTIVTAEV
jgi:hypothetical protein